MALFRFFISFFPFPFIWDWVVYFLFLFWNDCLLCGVMWCVIWPRRLVRYRQRWICIIEKRTNLLCVSLFFGCLKFWRKTFFCSWNDCRRIVSLYLLGLTFHNRYFIAILKNIFHRMNLHEFHNNLNSYFRLLHTEIKLVPRGNHTYS